MAAKKDVDVVECKWSHDDCFGHADKGEKLCVCLTDTDFPGRDDCPFYKSMERHIKELDEEGKYKLKKKK